MYEIINENVFFQKKYIGSTSDNYAFSFFTNTNVIITHGEISQVKSSVSALTNILSSSFNFHKNICTFYMKMTQEFCDFMNEIIDFERYNMTKDFEIIDLMRWHFDVALLRAL